MVTVGDASSVFRVFVAVVCGAAAVVLVFAAVKQLDSGTSQGSG